MSWARATSPISRTTGPAPAAATPNALEIVPSMPLAPRLDRTRGAVGARRPEALDVADRHRRGHEQRRPRGRASAPSDRATAGSLSSSPRTSSSARPPGRRPPASAASQAAGAGAGRAAPSTARGSPWTQLDDDVVGVLPGAVGRDRDLTRAVVRGQPGAQGLRGRQVADADHELGLRGRSRVRAAGRRSGRSPPARGGRRKAGRRAGGSPAGRRRPGSRRLSPASTRPATITARPRRAARAVRRAARAARAPPRGARRAGRPPAVGRRGRRESAARAAAS